MRDKKDFITSPAIHKILGGMYAYNTAFPSVIFYSVGNAANMKKFYISITNHKI